MLKEDGRIAEMFDIHCLVLVRDRIYPDGVHRLIGWGTEAVLITL